MKIHLIAAGDRPPGWVAEGYQEYARRLSGAVELKLHEIRPAARRPTKADVAMLAAVPAGTHVVALDVAGKPWSSAQLAGQLKEWMHLGRDIALLVGGADGLSEECMQRADQRWSLGSLTLPHMLVRVVVAEQLYRAWSIVNHHPYHRD